MEAKENYIEHQRRKKNDPPPADFREILNSPNAVKMTKLAVIGLL